MEWATRKASTSNAGVGWNGSPGRISPEIGADVHLVEALRDQRQREPRPVDRNVALAEEEGQGAHVVLVGVGEEHRAELGGRVTQVAEVGDDQLDAGKLWGWEEQAGVDQEELVLALEDHRVEADFAESAEGDDAQHCGGTYARSSLARAAFRRRGAHQRSLRVRAQ